MEDFKITETGIIFVPRFVKSESDYNYGELVSHEAFNERLNLNTTQGDYNTEILRLLFTDPNAANVPHIPYLDNVITEEVNRINTEVKDLQETSTDYTDSINQALTDSREALGSITKIITGELVPKYANDVTGIEDAGTNKYYGTDETGQRGFYNIPNPESLYAESISSGAVEIDGIYFTPREASVTETMLDEDVQLKLNRSSITDYNYLDNRPTINGVALEGNVTLEELGIQSVGDFITAIPEEYVTDTELTEALNPYLTTQVANDSYAAKETVNGLSNTVNTINGVANRAAVICVGSFTGTPKTGDLLITV